MTRIGIPTTRAGIPTMRMGATARIGKMNDSVDHTPSFFQQEGLLQRVASREEQKKGIIGYSARGVVTFSNLKIKNEQLFNKKISELEQKKKKVSPELSHIYKESQDILSKYAKQTKEAKKLQDLLPFSLVNQHVAEYVEMKKEIINPFVNRVEQIQGMIERSKGHIKRNQERMGMERDRERLFRLYANEDKEIERINAYEKQLKIIKDFLDKNVKNIKFGEEMTYYPYNIVNNYSDQIWSSHYNYHSQRIDNRMWNRINTYRNEQNIREQYPYLTDTQVKKATTELMKTGTASIPPHIWKDPTTGKTVVVQRVG